MTTKHPALVPDGASVEKQDGGSAGEQRERAETGRDADLVFLDRAGVVVSWSAAAVLMTGLPAAQAVGKALADIGADRDITNELDGAAAGPVEIGLTTAGSGPDDDQVRAVVSANHDTAGSLTGYRLRFLPPSVRQEAAVALSGAMSRQYELQDLEVQDSPAFLVEGSDLLILDSNRAAAEAFGRASGGLAGLALQDVLDAGASRVRAKRPAGGKPLRFLHLTGAEGTGRSYGVSLQPLHCGDREMALCVLHELTAWVNVKDELKKMNLELSRLARHDHLTGLFNRPMFHDTLELANSRLDRLGGLLGVLYIDLDNFKPINDKFGHEAGDAVLIEVARRLKSGVRSSDVVARLGGDEFGAILENLKKRSDALKVARHLIASLAEPFEAAGEPVRISASIGAAVTSNIVEDASSMVVRADRMMYEAKSRGRGRVALAPAGQAAKYHRTQRRS